MKYAIHYLGSNVFKANGKEESTTYCNSNDEKQKKKTNARMFKGWREMEGFVKRRHLYDVTINVGVGKGVGTIYIPQILK